MTTHDIEPNAEVDLRSVADVSEHANLKVRNLYAERPVAEADLYV
jgi:hypothetical protein